MNTNNMAIPYEQRGITSHEYFTIGGTVGTMYMMKLQVNGVSEAKFYMGGTRPGGSAVIPQAELGSAVNSFYIGGSPVDFQFYNVYKLTVRHPPAAGGMPATATEVQHYYLNSFPKVASPNYEDHATFPISYTADIPVPGGGVIEYSTGDANCRAVDNCGSGFGRGTPCAASGGINVPNDPNLVIPMMYMGQAVSGYNQRNGANQPYHSQIFHLKVLSVTAM